MTGDPLESKAYLDAAAAEAAAVTTARTADRARSAAQSELQGLDAQVRTNIGAWSLERQTSERERLTWQYNVACAAKIKADDDLKAAKSKSKAARAQWLADPAAREAAAQRYSEQHAVVTSLTGQLREAIRALDATNGVWQAMSQTQQPDVYSRFNGESVIEGSQRAKDLMWILDGNGDMFIDVPHMSREAAKSGVTVPAA